MLFVNCLSGASCSLTIIYLSIVKIGINSLIVSKVLVKGIWVYYATATLLTTVIYGVLAENNASFSVYFHILWTFLLFSFKKYLERNILFFLLKFLFLVMLFTQALVVLFVRDFFSFTTMAILTYYIGFLTWELEELYSIYNRFINGLNITKNNSAVLFEHTIKKTVEALSSKSLEPICCPICYE
jgi:hypothetical protein